MSINFLDHIRTIAEPRISGMVTYPLDEILFSTLVGLLCRAEDWDEIEFMAREQLDWLRRFLPFESGIPQAQTYRRLFATLDPKALEAAFSNWVSSLQSVLAGVIAIDGKTLCGSKKESSGKGALHVLSAYAHEAGLVIAQRAVGEKSNEITAIPDLLDSLVLNGAIVTIDAMGCQKEITRKIRKGGADYVLALKGNQRSLHTDVKTYFDDPVLRTACPVHQTTDGGHGRIEERTCRVVDAGWLAPDHGGWTDMATMVEITSECTNKKTGEITGDKRYYISSLGADPKALLAAIRAHWSIENNLHWQLDVTFREDENRTRKDHAALNFTIIRRAALNMLKKEKSKMSLKRKRLKALMDNQFREKLLKC
jgi:predicted transposase YbfD/YdcC